jgi:hypothetical protein
MKKFKEFINESLRDKMVGKPVDDFEEKLKDPKEHTKYFNMVKVRLKDELSKNFEDIQFGEEGSTWINMMMKITYIKY